MEFIFGLPNLCLLIHSFNKHLFRVFCASDPLKGCGDSDQEELIIKGEHQIVYRKELQQRITYEILSEHSRGALKVPLRTWDDLTIEVILNYFNISSTHIIWLMHLLHEQENKNKPHFASHWNINMNWSSLMSCVPSRILGHPKRSLWSSGRSRTLE